MISTTTQQPLHFLAKQGHDFDEIVTPIAERIANIFNVNYIIFWTLSGVLVTSIHTFIITKHGGISAQTLVPSITFGILPFAALIFNVYFSKLLERFTPSLFNILSWDYSDTYAWYSKELKSIFSDKSAFVLGFIIFLLITPSAFYSPIFPKDNTARISFLVIIGILNITSGTILFPLYRIIKMIDKLGKTNVVNVSIYQHPLTSIKAIGLLMTRVSVITLSLYTIGIAHSLVCDTNPLTKFITAMFGAVIFILFITPQIKIHTIMANVKHERLIMFSGHLENALRDVTQNPSEKNVSQVRELFAIQNSLNNMSEWPFNTKNLITILTGIAIPILVVLIQILCNR